jgi:integrase/recombinase XerC
MTTTLTPQLERYIYERRARGEIGAETARNQRCHLRGLADSFGARPLNRLTRREVERWQETIGHLSPATRRARLSTVRTFCRWLVDRRAIMKDPTAGLPSIRQPRTVPRALPRQAIIDLLGQLPDRRADLIIWLMVGLGLRCCEVSRLELADYDPAGSTLTVRGKGGHQRVLPVDEPVRRAIVRYLAETGVIHGPLIRSRREPWAGLAPDSISRYVSQWMSDAGVKYRLRDGVSAHALRHTAASDVFDRCHDLRVVQEMLGHASLKNTEIYLRRASMGRLRSAMAGRDYAA